MKEIIIGWSSDGSAILRSLNHVFDPVIGSGFCMVVSDDGVLEAVVTDADLRRFVQSTGSLPSQPSDLARTDFVFLTEAEMASNDRSAILIERMRERGTSRRPIAYLPIVSDSGKPVSVKDLKSLVGSFGALAERVVVIGLGYVGSTLAASFASAGAEVIGIDRNEKRLEILSNAETPLEEPGVREAFSRSLGRNLSLGPSILGVPKLKSRTTTYCICVETNLAENRSYESNLEDICKELASQINVGDRVVVRSTVRVGTTRKLGSLIERLTGLTAGIDFSLASAPERTLEGAAMKEIADLPQLIGAINRNSANEVANLFDLINEAPMKLKDLESAEMSKLIGNAWRDYTFAFANRVAQLCSQASIDVNHVISSSNLNYPRSSIPMPSPGVGGSCLVKDSYLLEEPSMPASSPIIAARRGNERMPNWVVTNLEHMLASNDHILLVGMAFKGQPPTPDLRHSPSIEVLEILCQKEFTVFAVDAESPLYPITNDIIRSRYSCILVLNNHPENQKIVEQTIQHQSDEEILVYDPWHVISTDSDAMNFSRCRPKILSASWVER